VTLTLSKTTVSNPSGVQGSYPIEMDVAHEGMVADNTPCVVRSYYNQTGSPILFGRLVESDSVTDGKDQYSVKHVDGVAGILGVAISTVAFEGVSGTSTYTPNPTNKSGTLVGYPDKTTVNVLSKGVVWVIVTEAVNLGDVVRTYVAAHTTAGAAVGRFCKTAVSNKTADISGIAAWRSAATANSLALLELNVPASVSLLAADG